LQPFKLLFGCKDKYYLRNTQENAEKFYNEFIIKHNIKDK